MTSRTTRLALTAGDQVVSSSSNFLVGVLVGRYAGPGPYGAYILACSRVARKVDPLVTATVIIAGAAVIYVGTALVLRSPLPPTAHGWALVATIGVVSTAIAIATFFAAMERIGATSAAIGSTLEPIVTVVMGAIVLGEQLTIVQIAGGALIVASVAWLTLQPRTSSA